MKLPFGKKADKPPKLQTPDDRMTLTEHLGELRMRIIRCLLAVTLGFVLIMVFYNQVISFLGKPYEDLCRSKPKLNCENGGFFVLSPLEGFSTRVSVSTYGALIVALPVLLWQLWKFIVPGLHAHEKRYAIPFILSSVLLFLLGAVIAYLTLEPAIGFLLGFSGDKVTGIFQISKYIEFVGIMLAAFGIGLEFPLLLVFLMLVNVVSYRTLLRGWRYAICGIILLAAVITPSGDPISLAALGGPMLILYFVAIGIGRKVQLKREKNA
jgi:sec-independent protein translocase protein TatC